MPTGARLDLMLFALRQPPEMVERNRAYAHERGWRRAFLDAVDEAGRFAQRVRQGTPDQVLALSRTVRAGRGDRSEALADAILLRAVDKGDREADFEWTQRLMRYEPSDVLHQSGRLRLREMADANYPPALLDIVSRYLDGNALPRDERKAYYWMLRAAAAGLSTDRRHDELSDRLSPHDKELVERWLRLGTKIPL